ncbi:MAG: hypothetical protein PUH24_06195 [Prevotellaceae bacterium]|nr:hypothetical protein [Prevotella sp.]MDD7257842.1 hypothetical protein [Prevotellaceae bacterium]MDY6130076.1 hypothetical protein [Prevotella sp.]
MKRTSRWLISFVLSIAIVWMGAGVSVMHCLHTGNIQIADMQEALCQAAECETETGGECMEMQTVRLSPTPMAQTLLFDFAEMPVVSLLSHQFLAFQTCSDLLESLIPTYAELWHSPPRAYLYLIRILTI